MHPPWITFHLIFLVFATITWTSGNPESSDEKEDGNSTVSRAQREIIERERRLIPYMTYYVTQGLTNPNSARQNVFIPISSPRENILHFGAVPQITANNLQNINPQQFQLLAKPIVRVQEPSYVPTSSIQGQQQRIHYKPKEESVRVLGPIYNIQGANSQPAIPQQLPPQPITAGTQPLSVGTQSRQIIKVNPVLIEQKYGTPQIIKIIPYITKLPAGDRAPKTFSESQPQYTYANAKLLPNPYIVNGQNYYSEPVTPRLQNTYQRIPTVEVANQIRPSLRPDKNKYTLAKIYISSTTPTPYTNAVKFDLNDGRATKIVNNVGPIDISRLNPPLPSYTQSVVPVNSVPALASESPSTVAPPQQQVYYTQKVSESPQTKIIPQSSQEIVHHRVPEELPRLRVPQEEDEIKYVASVTPISVTNDLGTAPQKLAYDEDKVQQEVDLYKAPNFEAFLSILKETSKLPQNLTPDNIDNGIKTLALILERLQQQKQYQDSQKLSGSSEPPPKIQTAAVKQVHKKVHSYPQPSGTSTPGVPGVDYPTYSSIPRTSFDCSTQRYKGFFGDPETKCQVWHYCDLNGGQASFLCPNGTIFSQVALTCDWWFNVKCASTSQLYVLNERLYKYILPFSPSFPEDYSGPIVDTYLAAKFKEMEAKSKSKALKSPSTTAKPETTTNDTPTEAATDESFEDERTISTEVY